MMHEAEQKRVAAGDPVEQAPVHPMDALLDSSDYELEAPRRGEIRTGTIARITESDVLVDIGAKSEGVISARELEQLTADQRAMLGVGREIAVYVLRSGGGNPPELSLARAEEEHDWVMAEELLGNKEIYQGEVSGFNKGGLIVNFGRLRGFMPASQVSLPRRRRAEGDTPDKRWGKMIGEQIVTKVIEVDRRRNRLILSERSAAREAREALKERLITQLTVGEVRSGHIISLAEFGAFVDIGGADGLVHVSEISWKRVNNPRDVLKIGDEVQVRVLAVDPERNRISLSIRELLPNPWELIRADYGEGKLVQGKITKLTKFGAFASLVGLEEYGIEGLVHISELSDHRISHPSESVQEGQELTLRVIRVEPERRRIGLSLRRVDSAEYVEQDWASAVQGQVPEEVLMDFDAELDAEAELAGLDDEPAPEISPQHSEPLPAETEPEISPDRK